MLSVLLALVVITGTPTLHPVQEVSTFASSSVPSVPFYSQFKDISSASWQKVGCGIASLAMVVDYYSTSTISVNHMLSQGIKAGAYLNDAGWTYAGLILVGEKYGLYGKSYLLSSLTSKDAFVQLKNSLEKGPVIASVHYKFDPKNPIPHLVVVNGVDGDFIYYNDPASNGGAKKISIADFLHAWKKRYIVMRPVKENNKIAYR